MSYPFSNNNCIFFSSLLINLSLSFFKSFDQLFENAWFFLLNMPPGGSCPPAVIYNPIYLLPHTNSLNSTELIVTMVHLLHNSFVNFAVLQNFLFNCYESAVIFLWHVLFPCKLKDIYSYWPFIFMKSSFFISFFICDHYFSPYFFLFLCSRRTHFWLTYIKLRIRCIYPGLSFSNLCVHIYL